MTDLPAASLAYLSQPKPGQAVLNLQVGGRFDRFELTDGQVRNMVADGARMLSRGDIQSGDADAQALAAAVADLNDELAGS